MAARPKDACLMKLAHLVLGTLALIAICVFAFALAYSESGL